jgi:exodeoxyribonuclease VIII
MRHGLKMDASTVMWWMKQSDQARAAFNEKGVSLSTALSDFMDWLDDKALVWGNGATFDNVILDNAYRATGLTKPWKYNADRCYRTLKALYPQVPAGERSGTYHNALDDAKHQAMHASRILNLIG